MHFEFAYSRIMQIILAVISLTTAFIFAYSITNTLIKIYGQKVTKKQKIIFALLVGTLMDSVFVYAIYILRGMEPFSNVANMFITTSNPVFALLYYYFGIKVLCFPAVRSIRLTNYYYMVFVSAKSFGKLLVSLFFKQSAERYNYFQDAVGLLCFLALFLGFFAIIRHKLEKNKHMIDIRDNLFINLKKEIVFYFFKAAVVYFLAVGIPLIIKEEALAYIMTITVLSLILSLAITKDLYRAAKCNAENKLAHINMLSKTSAVTYLGDNISLKEKINENPSIISLLDDKFQYAQKMNIKMKIEMNTRLRDLYIDNVDACLIINCLLDNAIKSAAASKHKRISFMVDSKGQSKKLLIVNNSIDESVVSYNKRMHWNNDFSTVWKTIENYGNCIFHLSYYNDEITAYFETIRPVSLN